MSTEESPAKWALDLFDHPPEIQDSFLHRNFGYITTPIIAACTPAVRNMWLRRPYYAGIHYHIGCAILGFGAAIVLDKWDKNILETRTAVYRHYISLYPDRFPEPPHPKFADVLYEWRPIR